MVHVPLPGPLVETVFVARPNRFLLRCAAPARGSLRERRPQYGEVASDVVYEAHLADPGRLREVLVPGARVWLRAAAPTPHRRTRWSAVLAEAPAGAGLISIDTTLPNRLAGLALAARAIAELADWELAAREVAFGSSRLDFVLRRGDERLALEVKSVTLVEDDVAQFPDAVTARGARHLRELARIAAEPGWQAAVLFILQRPDAARITAAAHIDPDFARALGDARAAGVRVLGRRCFVSLERLALGDALPVT